MFDNYLNKAVGRQRMLFLMFAWVMKLLLSIFIFRLSEAYSYYGVIANPRGFELQLLSGGVFTVIALMIDHNLNKPSGVLHFVLFLFCYLPISVQYDINKGFGFESYWLLSALFLALPLSKKIPVIALSYVPIRLEKQQYLVLVLASFTLLIGVIILHYGFRPRVLGISEIYDQRDTFKLQSNRISEYAFNWVINVLSVVVLLIGLMRKNLLLVLVSFGVSFYLFGIGGHKSVLFIVPLALTLYLVYKMFKKNLLLWMLGGVTFLFFLLLVLDYSTGESSLVTSIIVRRGFLLPAQIFFHYDEFFSTNPLNFFSQSFPFSLFSVSPYAEKIPTLIGSVYFPFIDSAYANGNIFADGIANLGYWSFLVMFIVLSLLYRVTDVVTAGKSRQFVIPVVFIIGYTFANSGLIVSLVTHGFLVGILFLSAYPRRRLMITK